MMPYLALCLVLAGPSAWSPDDCEYVRRRLAIDALHKLYVDATQRHSFVYSGMLRELEAPSRSDGVGARRAYCSMSHYRPRRFAGHVLGAFTSVGEACYCRGSLDLLPFSNGELQPRIVSAFRGRGKVAQRFRIQVAAIA